MTSRYVVENPLGYLAMALHQLARDVARRRKLAQAGWERTSSFRLENVAEDWARLLFQ